ncbi:MAG: hypothetical protein K0U98_04205 [Deltaproteobacteria bacterium]|nr:hypothetical protein [Deltaproteobacteria bacterium]
MPKRRSSSHRSPRSQAGRSRRVSPRRSPQDNVRVAAEWVIERTLSSLAPVDSFLATVLAAYDDRDRALLRELVFGTLRWLRRIDHVITSASSRSFADIEAVLHAPLRVATYQLLFLDRVPAHAAVHEAVEQAHCLTHRGAASFVNAVLRRIAREPKLSSWPVTSKDPVRRMAIELSHPDFLVRRWCENFGEERAEAFMRANNQSRPTHLLAFRHLGGRELLAERLIDEGLEVQPSALSPLGLIVRRGNPLKSASFEKGQFYIQDEISQLAALLPPPKPGERVLDAAAAPGGKSFALLAWEPKTRVVMADVSPARLALLRANLARLDLSVPLFLGDAGSPPLAGGDGLFDRVVVDLPCSGTGTLRKNPELKWRLSEAEVGRLATQASRMLNGLADRVLSGGILVAITCSVEKEENEEVVEHFLQGRDDFQPLPLHGVLQAPRDRFIAGPGMWRVFPGGDHDGFTVHVLKRS